MKSIPVSLRSQLLRFIALSGTLFITSTATAANQGYSYGSTAGKSGNCLSCHANQETVGERYLIDPARYNHTSHARIGCPACHDAVSPVHPNGGNTSLKVDCLECHRETGDEYARSGHADKAVCGDCHKPHRVSNQQEISGQEMNRMCASCHDGGTMTSEHAKWLPQADLHLEMLPCVTCHTASKDYLISLYLIKRDGDNRYGEFKLASFKELDNISGGKGARSLVDLNGDTYISLAELRLFNENPKHKLLRLQGVMIPEKITHSFQILDNRRDCTFCHASGPGAMQASFLALPEQNGTFTRVAVEKGAVLEALGSTPDFYMTGATRNASLNMIGLAVIAGGMVMPIGHGFLRFLTRKNRKERSSRHE